MYWIYFSKPELYYSQGSFKTKEEALSKLISLVSLNSCTKAGIRSKLEEICYTVTYDDKRPILKYKE
ncbi:hypothetical protein KY330_02615 [Candidatus Woesearchaeota archaeon]|nr:hypothetical protein [Candidatus Woesearchaeota archaeon]